MGFSNIIAFAFILRIPEENFTINLFRRTWDMTTCSAKVKSFSCGGTLPNHRPFARAYFGVTPSRRHPSQDTQIYGHVASKTGPFTSCIMSSTAHRSIRVIPMFSRVNIPRSHLVSDRLPNWVIGVSCPHTAQPASMKLSGEVSSHQFRIMISFSFIGGGGGGNGWRVLCSFSNRLFSFTFFAFCNLFFSFLSTTRCFCAIMTLLSIPRLPYHFRNLSEFDLIACN